MWYSKICTLLVVLWLAGCTNIGAGTIPRDRTDFMGVLGTSWNRQLLLNLVKVRYAEFPVFLEVGQIVTGYDLESTGLLNLTQVLSGLSDSSSFESLLNIGGAARYRDRPTISYTPLTGVQFMKNLMSPIPPAAILFMLQAGYAADFVLSLCVDSINNLHNRSGTAGRWRAGHPGFYRLTELLRNLQAAGGIRMIIRQEENKKEVTLIAVGERKLDPEAKAAVKEIRQLMGVQPDLKEYKVIYGNVPSADNEIAMLTRSVLRILIELASYVEVPKEHMEEGRTWPALAEGAEKEGTGKPLLRIHSSTSAPDDALVAVSYRDHWFWVDDKDLMSKRTFAMMVLLFTISETGTKEGLPVLTIETR